MSAGSDLSALRPVLLEAAERMRDNYPYQHPLYAGQMLKPPHPVARLAYAMAQFINPNNHAMDGGRASSVMEREAVAELAGMIGWETHLGHLCGGGTMANMEALWVSGRVNPGKRVVASDQAHYTHGRISEVLQIPFSRVASDAAGRMDIVALKDLLDTGEIGTVVATLGTTGIGTTDPLPEILARADVRCPRSRRRRLWRIFYPREQSARRDTRGIRRRRRGGFRRHRPPQAWTTALRVWLRTVPGSGRRRILQTRFTLYLLYVVGAASR